MLCEYLVIIQELEEKEKDEIYTNKAINNSLIIGLDFNLVTLRILVYI